MRPPSSVSIARRDGVGDGVALARRETVQHQLRDGASSGAVSCPASDFLLGERPLDLQRTRPAPRAAGAACCTGSPSSAAQERGVERDVADRCRRPRAAAPAGRCRALASASPAGTRAARSRRAASRRGTETRRRSAGAAGTRRRARAAHVGGQDGQAAVRLHALQQIADLDVGVAVVAVLDLAALAEQRIGLVEQQDRAAVLGGVEDAAQILLRLADVLADDLATGRCGRGRGAARRASTSAAMVLPVPLAPANSALMPEAAGCGGRSPSCRRRVRAGARARRSARSMSLLRLGQHEVVPRRRRLDALREIVQARPRAARGRRPTAAVRARLPLPRSRLSGRRRGDRARRCSLRELPAGSC